MEKGEKEEKVGKGKQGKSDRDRETWDRERRPDRETETKKKGHTRCHTFASFFRLLRTKGRLAHHTITQHKCCTVLRCTRNKIVS